MSEEIDKVLQVSATYVSGFLNSLTQRTLLCSSDRSFAHNGRIANDTGFLTITSYLRSSHILLPASPEPGHFGNFTQVEPRSSAQINTAVCLLLSLTGLPQIPVLSLADLNEIRYKITTLNLIPSLVHQLVNSPKTKNVDFSSLIWISSGAAYLPDHLARKITQLAPKVNMTEGAFHPFPHA